MNEQHLDAAAATMRGTDSAALASVCTEGRLAELDAGNLTTDIAAILNDTGADGVTLLSDTQASIDAMQADLDIITGADGVNLLSATQASIDAIEADTNELQTDWVDAGRLDALVYSLVVAVITNAAGADVATDVKALKAETVLILSDTNAILVDTATTLNGLITTVDTVVDGIQTDLSNATDGLGALKTLIDALNDISTADILTTALTESYASDGSTATLSQLLYMISQSIIEFSISGTTITIKKLDGSTTAMTCTLDDASNPTSRTRAT